MKYFIQINQEVLSKYKSLDVKDAAILDYLRAWCQADDKKVKQLSIKEEGIEYRYTWINFNFLITEIPLLKIKSKSAISERISKIEKTGFIKTFKAPDQNLYVRLTEKIKELEFKEGKRGVRPDEQRCSSKRTDVFVKTNSTNNILYKHNINKQYNIKNLENFKRMKEKLVEKMTMLNPQARTQVQEMAAEAQRLIKSGKRPLC
jgi:hypothetical protein